MHSGVRVLATQNVDSWMTDSFRFSSHLPRFQTRVRLQNGLRLESKQARHPLAGSRGSRLIL